MKDNYSTPDPYGEWKNPRLLASKEESKKEYWDKIYHQYFPTMISSSIVDDDMRYQDVGVDRIIYLYGGKQVYIDEKIRTRDYGDIALEESSSIEHQRPGWMQKPMYCDYIAYKTPVRTYMLPFHQLQAAWFKNKNEWKEKYKEVRASNSRYTSLSWAIPVAVLFLAMAQINII